MKITSHPPRHPLPSLTASHLSSTCITSPPPSLCHQQYESTFAASHLSSPCITSPPPASVTNSMYRLSPPLTSHPPVSPLGLISAQHLATAQYCSSRPLELSAKSAKSTCARECVSVMMVVVVVVVVVVVAAAAAVVMCVRECVRACVYVCICVYV